MDVVNLINSVGFPIFACIYLSNINTKVLNTIDKRLQLIELKIDRLEEKNNEQK